MAEVQARKEKEAVSIIASGWLQQGVAGDAGGYLPIYEANTFL
jgi:hypothetical protein